MVFGRLLQGISAAVVWSVGLALLVDTVGTEGVGKSMGNVGYVVLFWGDFLIGVWRGPRGVTLNIGLMCVFRSLELR